MLRYVIFNECSVLYEILTYRCLSTALRHIHPPSDYFLPQYDYCHHHLLRHHHEHLCQTNQSTSYVMLSPEV